jgi:hypothetical protein
MSSIAEIMSLVSALSLNDKLQLNAQLATAMAPSPKTKGSNEPKAKSSRAGKPASLGTRAWGAFVKHVQETMPERFAPPALPKERLVIAGAIRLENPSAYEAFCAKFKDENPVAEAPESQAPESQAAPQSDASESESQVAESQAAPQSDASESESQPEAEAAKPKQRKPRAKLTDEQKAIMKAKTAATKAKKAAEATA